MYRLHIVVDNDKNEYYSILLDRCKDKKKLKKIQKMLKDFYVELKDK